MAKVKGTDGLVKVGANTVAAVVSFSLDETNEPIEDTELAVTDKNICFRR